MESARGFRSSRERVCFGLVWVAEGWRDWFADLNSRVKKKEGVSDVSVHECFVRMALTRGLAVKV